MSESGSSPGVYVEELAPLPPAVAPVETAVPAFIGFTERAVADDGAALTNVPIRIGSLLEYERYFGKAPSQAFSVNVTQHRHASSGRIVDTHIAFSATPPRIPPYLLYYSLQMYFANGGGPCYVLSIGDTTSTTYSSALFTAAIAVLERHDEPTLYVFPDACSHRASNIASDADVGAIVDAALESCARTRDRFTIADVRDAIAGGTDTNAKITTAFREKILSDTNALKYGAAYFPYLETGLEFVTADDDITITAHEVISIEDDGTERSGPGTIAAGTRLSDPRVVGAGIYNAVRAFIDQNSAVTLPPSGAIAGVYARVDASRGVWKAPANVGLALVNAPAITVTDELNADLNVDAGSGKSVNVIRAFKGKGTLVWGARTLAGNDNEWRYVPVRRFCSFVEESVQKATAAVVFEPNDAATWARVRAMIENFLTLLWRQGALAGSKAEHAFYVRVGLNQTMTIDDMLNGRMIVEIGLAVVRPGEFIALRIVHTMQAP